jgi:hypothetical protein
MIKSVFNVLLEDRGNKKGFFLREQSEVNNACIVIQTLNKIFYAKSYRRMPRGGITGKGFIDKSYYRDNFFRGVNYRASGVRWWLLHAGDQIFMSDTIVPVYAQYTWNSKSECLPVCGA